MREKDEQLCEVCGRSVDVCNAGRINHDPYELAAHYALGYEREKARADAAQAMLASLDKCGVCHCSAIHVALDRVDAAEAAQAKLTEALRAAREYVFGDHGAPSLRDRIDAALASAASAPQAPPKEVK